jgi:Tfp pilus assembly ATPase PilU
MQTLRKGGLNTLEDHLIELVRNGSVKKEDALRVANEPRSMAALA